MTLTGNIVTIISKLCNIQCTISPLRPLRATYASSSLKSILQNKIPRHREEVRKLRDKHGSVKLGEVTVDMIYGGMRGLTPLVCETSWIDLDEGVKFRGLSIPECERRMPKADGSDQPLPEGLFWLLLTGDVPTLEQAKDLSEEWASRADVPSHVVTMLSNMPKTLHPMSQLSAAVTTLNNDSKFAKAYCEGVHKSKYWEYVLEDSMDLLAKLPVVAALIYRNVYHAGRPVMPVDCNRDWAANFCHMLGFHEHGFDELMRLHLFIHGDHGSGNVSAHTAHLVGSALSDPYLAWAAGINGFAGPLHGVANQECTEIQAVLWLEKLLKEAGDNPTDDQLNKFVRKTLDSGQVVPGFGHAVLRKTDQRYISNRKFALKHLPDDPLFKLVEALYRVVPPILMETGRIKNPWPNADAVTGIILKHYGLHEARYCPVLLCVSRALGVLAQMVWARALGLPIERPDSLTTDLIAQRIQQRNDEQSDCYLIF